MHLNGKKVSRESSSLKSLKLGNSQFFIFLIKSFSPHKVFERKVSPPYSYFNINYTLFIQTSNVCLDGASLKNGKSDIGQQLKLPGFDQFIGIKKKFCTACFFCFNTKETIFIFSFL